MSLDNPQGGIGYAAEFQSSALPWVTSSSAPATGSPVRYDFPKVTRFITVTNHSTSSTDTLAIGFTRAGLVTAGNKYVIPPGETITFELRIRNLFLQGESGTPNYSLLAGLTNISVKNMPILTGTLSDGSRGWAGVG